jgi:glycerol uptake facilitator-like aquaporin
MFPKFYKHNKSKINFLFTEILNERFKRHPTLEIQKNIDVYKCRQEQIEKKTAPQNIRKNMVTELIMMVILIFAAISASNPRRNLNMLLMMKSKK